MNKSKNHIELHKHLSHQELIDYNNAVLGNEEMYRIELHLNECELCTDALDGFGKIKNPDELIASIKNNILPTKENSKINYLAIAASVVLIATIGFSYWLIDNTSKDQNLALNTPVKQEVKNKAEETKEEDFSAKKDNQTEEVVEELVVQDNNELTTPGKAIEGVKPSITEAPTTPTPRRAEPVENNNLIAEAEIEEEASVPGVEVLKEENDQFKNDEMADTNQSAALQAMPSVTRSAKKATTSSTVVTLKDQKEPVPVGGMEALKSHIATNLKYPQQAIDTKTKGTVVLNVTISANGSIKNITVSKGIGSGCDEEAMRLISIGPTWTPKVANGVAMEAIKQVKVKFKN